MKDFFICIGGSKIRPIGSGKRPSGEPRHIGRFNNGFPCRTCGAIYATVRCPSAGQMLLAKLKLWLKLRLLHDSVAAM